MVWLPEAAESGRSLKALADCYYQLPTMVESAAA